MVRKEVCANCKGNKFVPVACSSGSKKIMKCPSCNGQGYKIGIVR